VVESDLEDDKKRSEILKIAHRMAKLRDIDRLHQAEQTLRGARAQQETAARAVVTADLAHFGSWGP
jgi:hypothetical protein